MSTLFEALMPHDLLFWNRFKPDLGYIPAVETKIPHPLDIYYDGEHLFFELACVGLTDRDVEVSITNDEIRFKYQKPKSEDFLPEGYIYHGISRKSFDYSFRVKPQYDLSKAKANMENGLLEVQIPLASASKPKFLKIN